jgi:YD repeat-containing protein
MLQAPCYQLSIDSGTGRTLLDVSGQPLYAWDTEDREFRMEYDALRRNTGKWLSGTGQLEKTIYGESYTPDPQALNLRGQVYEHYDASGKQSVPLGYDFKGNPIQSHLQLVLSKTLTDPDWGAAPPALATEVFVSSSTIDALGRPVTAIDPGGNETTYIYDKGGALKQVQLNGDPYVQDIHYDAKGQRQAIWYGNGTKTGYTYDTQTFRLRRLLTIKLSTNEPLQDLNYYYDPVGNITEIKDDAQQDVFFNNTVVSPTQQYTYDALYRLIEAHGREQKNNADFGSSDNTGDTEMLSNNPLKWDSGALQLYTQQYSYDEAGNILQLKHIAGTGSYTRDYNYSSSSNKLVTTEVGSWLYTYGYDVRGNMAAMPHLSVMNWNAVNELSSVTAGGNTTSYQYSGGQRIRKYTDKGSVKEERIYLGSYEIYRKFTGSSLTPDMERRTVHISDDSRQDSYARDFKCVRIGTVMDPCLYCPGYIYSNHLQSASLELNEVCRYH